MKCVKIEGETYDVKNGVLVIALDVIVHKISSYIYCDFVRVQSRSVFSYHCFDDTSNQYLIHRVFIKHNFNINLIKYHKIVKIDMNASFFMKYNEMLLIVCHVFIKSSLSIIYN